MAIVNELTKEDIGKKVICCIFDAEKGKKYGTIDSFTSDKICVRIDGSKKVIDYDYEEVDFDFQSDEEF